VFTLEDLDELAIASLKESGMISTCDGVQLKKLRDFTTVVLKALDDKVKTCTTQSIPTKDDFTKEKYTEFKKIYAPIVAGATRSLDDQGSVIKVKNCRLRSIHLLLENWINGNYLRSNLLLSYGWICWHMYWMTMRNMLLN
jgi:hypothetical protein